MGDLTVGVILQYMVSDFLRCFFLGRKGLTNLNAPKVLPAEWALNGPLPIAPLMLRPYLHALDVDALPTAKLAVGQRLRPAKQLLLTYRADVTRPNLLLGGM